ncbi:MAG: DUF2652 domain-containing protein [Saprospiraceae bacterium]|nr:DUF2652 domain-containing protein [Saprospiraceae bacterium]
MSTTTDSVTPALLFIPDISGFTRFITDTEISHSKHIIEELLEVMIEANTLDLQISEIEGDAILFYRFGEPPGATEMLEQVRRMFVNFHQQLRKYERYRICQCGACKTAHQLTLKMVAHYGEITQNKVKSFTKLFGKEVIVIHRPAQKQHRTPRIRHADQTFDRCDDRHQRPHQVLGAPAKRQRRIRFGQSNLRISGPGAPPERGTQPGSAGL